MTKTKNMIEYMWPIKVVGTTVSVIDTNTFSLIDTDGNLGNGITPITVGSGPLNIAVDEGVGSNKIYVTHYTDDLVSVIDTNNFAVTPIDLPDTSDSWGVAYDPIHDTMYVTDFNNANVFVISTTTNAIIDTITAVEGIGAGPTDITYDPDLRRMYVTNFNGGTVSVINTNTNTVIDIDGNLVNGITPITVGSQPVYVAYDPIYQDMYVTLQGDTKVIVIDTTTNQVIDTITVGSSPVGIAYDIIHDRMYVANQNDGTVSVINLCPSQQNTVKPSSISQEQMHQQQKQNNDKPSSISQEQMHQQQKQNNDKPSSISHEQMHQQQIVKLKQLLEATR